MAEGGRSSRRAHALLVLGAVVSSQALLAADCVDGKTPDCSDAAAQCGPNIDAASPDVADTSVTLPDAADGATDAAADAPDEADAGDLDAGDEI
jgi:hypothetical protein